MNIKAIIKEALQECGETLSDSAIQCVASWVEGAYENRELIDGPRSNHRNTEIETLKRNHAEEIKRLQDRERIFINSVATRRGVSPSDVYIEGQSVMVRV